MKNRMISVALLFYFFILFYIENDRVQVFYMEETYWGGNIKKNGLYDKIRELLSGFKVFEPGGIDSNPHIESVREGVALCKKEGIDDILAVGGGSINENIRKCIERKRRNLNMKIVVLEGSPNKNGSSNRLAGEFIRGAKEAGHSIEIIDAAHADIHPCTGCIHCGYEGPCVQKDDMELFRREILEADMMVFVTPLYYYGMSAQLKTLIDRFCAFNSSIQRKEMKSAILSAAWNSDNWTFDALEAHYDTLVRYLNLKDMGRVWGRGCGTPSMTSHSRYMKEAYELGRRLK